MKIKLLIKSTGDLVVADDDGVIVVPRKHALEMGRLAHDIMTGDQTGRIQKLEEPEKAKKK